MSDFSLVYQPKVRNGVITGLEALLRPTSTAISLSTFLEEVKDEVTLDIAVLKKSLKDIKVFNVNVPVSVNIHPRSLQNEYFVRNAIKQIQNRNVILELVENQHIELNETLFKNVALLRNHGIKLSVDDFGKDFARADLALAIKAEEIKFDRSLIKDIDENYSKFKHLSFLHSKMSTLCTDNIIFEGVETQRQFDLIKLFVKEPVLQGYLFYKPMPIEEIVKLDSFHNEATAKNKTNTTRLGMDLDYQIFNYLLEHKDQDIDSIDLNGFIRQHDILGLVYHEDVENTLANLRNIYFNNISAVGNGVMSLINATEKMVVMRNEAGVAIYDNAAHRSVVGGSIVGVDPQLLTTENESYKICLEKDRSLILDDDLMFVKDQELFDGVQYDTIREKMRYNDKNFIITTVTPINTNIVTLSRDELTGCYNRSFFKYHLNDYENDIVAFLDLNGFKAINDTYGHAIGDECLAEFANILMSSLRISDTIVRYGGDEFVLVLDALKFSEIDNKLKAINNKVLRHFAQKGYQLSFSHGLAKIEDHNLKAAIEEADRNMYSAKQLHKQKISLHCVI